MIIVQLVGGLGNQLFQYAAGRAVALLRGDELKLDIEVYQTPEEHRQYQLGAFDIQATLATPLEIERLRATSFIREKHLCFDPLLHQLQGDLYLSGYWQAPRYFQPVERQIRQELKVLTPISAEDDLLIKQMAKDNSVSIHVRRGDYTLPAYQHLGPLDLSYYQRAVELISQRLPHPHLYIFSDDLAYVRGHLLLNHPTTYVDHNNEEACVQDLRLMSCCRHHIIANSTFSWWSAYLNPRPDKMVVAPQRWFSSPHLSDRNLVCDHWIRI